MDNQNTSFNLNSNPTDPNQTPQTNPLNTGNGLPNTPPAAPEQMPHEIPIAVEAAPEPPVETVISNNNTPGNEATTQAAPAKSIKKYIIIAISIILVVTIGLALNYFLVLNSNSSETENQDDTEFNTLSSDEAVETSPEMEELEEVVEDLKDVYSDKNSDNSAPPSITIDLSEGDTPEEEVEETEPTPKKIAR